MKEQDRVTIELTNALKDLTKSIKGLSADVLRLHALVEEIKAKLEAQEEGIIKAVG